MPELHREFDRGLDSGEWTSVREFEECRRDLFRGLSGAEWEVFLDRVLSPIDGEGWYPPLEIENGDTVYHLMELKGRGSFGEVWRAKEVRPVEREVALKFVIGDVRDRLARGEASQQSQSGHPHICPVFGQFPHGSRGVIVMQYLPGGSLRARMKNGPVPPVKVAEVVLKLARALDAAHGAGGTEAMLHLDVKPENVVFDQFGEPRLCDFGIARSAGGRGRVGTRPYMAPEVVMGDPHDRPSDVWSLGVVMYEMLTGHRPFEDQWSEASGEPPPLRKSQAPKDVSMLCREMLAVQPSQRPSLAEVKDRLEVLALTPVRDDRIENVQTMLATTRKARDEELRVVVDRNQHTEIRGRVKELLARGGALVLRGDAGTGKSHMAAWLSRDAESWESEPLVLFAQVRQAERSPLGLLHVLEMQVAQILENPIRLFEPEHELASIASEQARLWQRLERFKEDRDYLEDDSTESPWDMSRRFPGMRGALERWGRVQDAIEQRDPRWEGGTWESPSADYSEWARWRSTGANHLEKMRDVLRDLKQKKPPRDVMKELLDLSGAELELESATHAQRIRDRLSELLRSLASSTRRPLLLIIDGLDELSDAKVAFEFLPTGPSIPRGVALIVTTRDREDLRLSHRNDVEVMDLDVLDAESLGDLVREVAESELDEGRVALWLEKTGGNARAVVNNAQKLKGHSGSSGTFEPRPGLGLFYSAHEDWSSPIAKRALSFLAVMQPVARVPVAVLWDFLHSRGDEWDAVTSGGQEAQSIGDRVRDVLRPVMDQVQVDGFGGRALVSLKHEDFAQWIVGPDCWTHGELRAAVAETASCLVGSEAIHEVESEVRARFLLHWGHEERAGAAAAEMLVTLAAVGQLKECTRIFLAGTNGAQGRRPEPLLWEALVIGAKGGERMAMALVGSLILSGKTSSGEEPDEASQEEARGWIHRSAALGDPGGMCRWGEMLLSGEEGVAKDVFSGRSWIRRSAEADDYQGTRVMFERLWTGDGFTKDIDEALAWLRRGAELGFTWAMIELGLRYSAGDGDLQLAREGLQWLRRVTEEGGHQAKHTLGRWLLGGRWTGRTVVLSYDDRCNAQVRDEVEGLVWLQAAAAEGGYEQKKDHLLYLCLTARAEVTLDLVGLFQEQGRFRQAGGSRLAIFDDLHFLDFLLTGGARQFGDWSGWGFGLESTIERFGAVERVEGEARPVFQLAHGSMRDQLREESRRILVQLAEGGDPKAMALLGLRLIYLVGFERNVLDGLAWLERAASSGGSDEMVILISELSKAGEAAEVLEPWRHRWAERGGCFPFLSEDDAITGAYYPVGASLGLEPAEVERLERLASDRGHSEAGVRLGVRMSEWRRPSADRTRGEELLLKGAEGGDPNAIMSLGVRTLEGRFPGRDAEAGHRWLEKYDSEDAPRLWKMIGRRLMVGEGMERDLARAGYWLRKAEAHGEDVSESLEELRRAVRREKVWQMRAAARRDRGLAAALAVVPMVGWPLGWWGPAVALGASVSVAVAGWLLPRAWRSRRARPD